MRCYPDIRAARPARFFGLARLIPAIHVYANVTFVGFNYSQRNEWSPRMRGYCLRVNHGAALFRKTPWAVPKIQVCKAL